MSLWSNQIFQEESLTAAGQFMSTVVGGRGILSCSSALVSLAGKDHTSHPDSSLVGGIGITVPYLFVKPYLETACSMPVLPLGPSPAPGLLLIVPGKQVELAWPLALSFPEGGSSEGTGPLLPLPLPT